MFIGRDPAYNLTNFKGAITWNPKERQKVYEDLEKMKNYQQPEEIPESEIVTEGQYNTISEEQQKEIEEHLKRYEQMIQNNWDDEQKRFFHYGKSKF